MSFFTWTPEMSVGVERLDEDHRSLISIINRLADSLEGQGEENEELIGKALTALARYTEIHFTREEEVMKAVDYPVLEEHRGEHEKFILDLYKLKAEYSDGNDDIRRELLDFLKNWLTGHIMVEDMKYRPHTDNSVAAHNAAECFSPLEAWTGR